MRGRVFVYRGGVHLDTSCLCGPSPPGPKVSGSHACRSRGERDRGTEGRQWRALRPPSALLVLQRASIKGPVHVYSHALSSIQTSLRSSDDPELHGNQIRVECRRREWGGRERERVSISESKRRS